MGFRCVFLRSFPGRLSSAQPSPAQLGLGTADLNGTCPFNARAPGQSGRRKRKRSVAPPPRAAARRGRTLGGRQAGSRPACHGLSFLPGSCSLPRSCGPLAADGPNFPEVFEHFQETAPSALRLSASCALSSFLVPALPAGWPGVPPPHPAGPTSGVPSQVTASAVSRNTEGVTNPGNLPEVGLACRAAGRLQTASSMCGKCG